MYQMIMCIYIYFELNKKMYCTANFFMIINTINLIWLYFTMPQKFGMVTGFSPSYNH